MKNSLPFILTLVVEASLALHSPAQLNWSNGTFPVAESLNSAPLGTGLRPTTHGAFPLVTFGSGAWNLMDGNALRARIYDAGEDTFFDHDDAFYFTTQFVDDGGSGYWLPETTVAMAAGQDQVIALSDSGRVALSSHFEAPFFFPSEENCPDNLSRLRDLAYSPYHNRWVAVAVKIFSSETGAVWTTRRENTGTGDTWQAVVGGPLFVAVSDTGKAIRSSDGTSWNTPVTINSSTNFQDIYYADGFYVAVGEDRIYSSPDAINWTARYTYPGASFISVTHGNGTWVAITTTGDRVHYSTNANASNWGSHTNINPTPLSQIVYGEGLFVAVGSGGNYRWSEADLQVPAPVTAGIGGSSIFRSVTSDWAETKWFASSPDEWIRLSDNWDPTGGGTSDTLQFLIEANPGNDRQGCIEVNGRAFPVYQPGTLGPVTVPFVNLEVHPLARAFLVTWDDVNNETGYQVERWTDDSQTFTVVGPPLPADQTYFHDVSLDPGDEYEYRITPLGSGLSSIRSGIFTAKDIGFAAQTIALPLGDEKVLVAWSDFASGNYLLTRNGTHLLPVVSGADPSGYRDPFYIDDLTGTSLAGGFVTVTYQVSSNSGTGNNFTNYPPLNYITSPMVGQVIGISEPLSPTVNFLQWQTVTALSAGSPLRFQYQIESAPSGSNNYSLLTTVDSPQYWHPINPGQKFHYRVKAVPTGFPNLASSTGALCSRFPSRPIDIDLTLTQTTASISLEFSNYNAGSWELQQQASSGSWFTIHTSVFDDIDETFNANNLTPGTPYNYRYRTIWRGVASDWLESGPRKSDLAAPLAPVVNDSDPGEIFLNWPDLNGAESYQVERSLNGTSGWTVLTSSATESRYTDTSVTPQTTYYYRVRGEHPWDTSDYSPVVSGTPPLDLALIFNYHDLRRFRFAPPAGYTSAELHRSTNSSFSTYTTVDTYTPQPPRDNFLVSDTATLGTGTVYYYRVEFFGAGHDSFSESRQIYPPVAPATSLTATLTIISNKDVALLNWTAPVNGDSYDVERREVTVPASEFETRATELTTTSYSDSAIEAGKSYEYRIIAKGSFPFWQPARPSNLALVALGNSVAAWRFFHFGTSANSGLAANSADPDDDGLDNLGELIFDLDPNVPNSGEILTINPQPNGSPLMRVSFRPREDYLDWPVDIFLTAGGGLSTFPSDLTSQVTINGEDKSHEYFSDTRLTSDQFFRLEFQEQ